MSTAMLKPGEDAREHFPIFSKGESKNLAYLDSAASTQKPREVVERLSHYLQYEHANIHRGAYALSGEATSNYEKARSTVANWINAPSSDSVVFTKSATESLNLISHGAELFFTHGDTLLLTVLEHHSNIVPWQMLAERKNLRIEYADVHSSGELDLEDLQEKIRRCKPKLIAVTHTSNAIGTINPLEEIVSLAREVGALVVVDATQAVAHATVDVQKLDADFLVFSGHKLYGPTGIGVLYGKKDLLDKMNPFLGGGDMITEVALEGSTWAEVPQKFEAGTPAIAEAIALGTAIEFLEKFNLQEVVQHEQELLQYAFKKLGEIDGLEFIGPIAAGHPQAAILSFNVKGIHPHDLATVADTHNVQIRAGHHCAMPLLKRLDLPATARMSIGIYTIKEDIDQLIESIVAAKSLFKV